MDSPLSKIAIRLAPLLQNGQKNHPLLIRSARSRFADPMETDRIEKLSKIAISPSNIPFLKSLYPIPLYNGHLDPLNPSKSSYINHDALYKQYCLLPLNPILHINPSDLSIFLRRLLWRRDFVRPSILSRSSNSDYHSPSQILSAYAAQISLRNTHLNSCWHVINDIRLARLHVLTSEMDQLLYMSFFRDHPSILNIVSRAANALPPSLPLVKSLNVTPHHVLNWESYHRLRQDLPSPLPILTLNTLLFSALRNDCSSVADDLIHTAIVSGETAPDSRFFRILIDHYAYTRDIPNLSRFISLFIDSHHHVLDIKLLNCILNALVTCGHKSDALHLIRLVMKNPSSLLSSQEFLKLLTPEDHDVYDQETLHSKPHKLFPTNHTMQIFIECVRPDVDEMWRGVNDAEVKFALPITTGTFLQIFHCLRKNSRVSPVLAATKKLLARHDSHYRSSPDLTLKHRSGHMKLPPSQMALFREVFHGKATPELPSKTGNFLKLSDQLVLAVYECFSEVLTKHGNQNLAKAVQEQKHELFATMKQTKNTTSSPLLRDELIYLKKGYLLALISMVETL